MQTFIEFNGKQYPVEKVITVAGMAPKGNFTSEDIVDMCGFDKATTSSQVDRIIYLAFEGKKHVILKPEKYKDINTIPVGAAYSFISKMLVKKLIVPDDVIIDPRPINNDFRYNDNRGPDTRNRGYGYNRPQQYNSSTRDRRFGT